MAALPETSELIEAVRLFLAEAETQLDGRAAFHAKVAGNALAIVERELAQKPAEAERSILATLLGHDGPPAALRAEVCAALRSGTMDAGTPGLVDSLLAAAAAQLAVDNPKYATLARLGD